MGDVATNYHAVSLKIKSVLDSTNAECSDEVANEGRDSTVAGMDTTDDESQVSLSCQQDLCLLVPFIMVLAKYCNSYNVSRRLLILLSSLIGLSPVRPFVGEQDV